MGKFDASCGLSRDQIGTIKYNIKKQIDIQLPVLPEIVETMLFFQGRDAWVYNWELKNEKIPTGFKDEIFLSVVVKLKKEFHQHLEQKRLNYSCHVKLTSDPYHPKVSLHKDDLGV